VLQLELHDHGAAAVRSFCCDLGSPMLCPSLHRQVSQNGHMPEVTMQPILAMLRAVAVLCWPPRSPPMKQGVHQSPWNQEDVSAWAKVVDNIAEVTTSSRLYRRTHWWQCAERYKSACYCCTLWRQHLSLQNCCAERIFWYQASL
jgi:hypothetical protein